MPGMTTKQTQPKSKISAILFDYGGVLAEEGFRNGLIKLAEEQSLNAEAMPAEGIKAVYDSGFVLGRGTAADFWSLMRERTGLIGDDAILTDRILSGFVIRPWMISLVLQCHEQGYVTGILSDQTYWLDCLNERDHFYDAFDHVFNSYTLGKGKQEPSTFNDVATDIGLPCGEILFIDDDAGNVKRAQEAGMQVLHYVDKDRFIQELEQRAGVYIK